MKYFAFLLLFLDYLPSEPQSNYPLPPNIKIVDIDIISGVRKEFDISGTGGTRPTGNAPMRAEHGVDPRTGIPPSIEGNSRAVFDSREQATLLPQLEMIVANYGTRTIKAIEWQYAYVGQFDNSALLQPPSLDRASWMTIRSKAKLRPKTIGRLSADLARVRRQGERPPVKTLLIRIGGYRITRVVYTSGPDWQAP